MNETEYHNPANLTPEQIGEGYELLKYGDEIQAEDEYWNRQSKQWGKTACAGSVIKKAHDTIFCAHRRRKKPELTIEPGKFYRTRDGRKARVYAVDGGGIYEVHGAALNDGKWISQRWLPNGHWLQSGDCHDCDLIAPWIDLPEVDWSKLPEFITCVTVDQDGEAWAWSAPENKVILSEGTWYIPSFQSIKQGYRLFPGTVKFSGDWKQSKVKRPEVAK